MKLDPHMKALTDVLVGVLVRKVKEARAPGREREPEILLKERRQEDGKDNTLQPLR